MYSGSLKTVAEVQEAVDALHVIVLSSEALRIVDVRASLFVAACADVLLVQQVVDGQIEVDGLAVAQVEDLAYGEVDISAGSFGFTVS